MNLKDYQVVVLGLLIACGTVLSTAILSKAVVEFQKLQNQTIRVTGSASQNVSSDFAVLSLRINARTPDLKSGYNKMNSDVKAIKEFLMEKGIDENAIDVSSIDSYEYYRRNGAYTSNDIEGYNVSQTVKVSSKDVNKITEISKQADALVDKNINITYNSLEYLVSNLDDIKVKMVGEATKNAKARAESMVKGTNGKIGVLNSARMGVFQIVPLNSTDVSDYGINDTSSLEKKVISTVNATFTVK
ncbi:SIMPL domain-containing protein [bacterium]|nr:SIMPL domain-containing protein [bacterium]